jgi:FtsP/CotA-like multicopper oxidase with cupredoxin domain
MTRRELLALGSLWACSKLVGHAQGSPATPRSIPTPAGQVPQVQADVTLRIGEISHELAHGRTIKTIAYNNQVPGPLLRARKGRPLVVDVWNDTSDEDIVHWHGLHIPSDVDGVYEQGTPGVPPKGGHQRYVFTPQPAGTRWYHSHNDAGRDFEKSTYSGQFGMLIVESGDDPGAYDLEVPILLHDWDARFNRDQLDIEYRYFSINGKMLGAGEPIRVRPSQRVLFRIVNASATMAHRLALPGHAFRVVALDGNPVPTPKVVPVIDLGVAERVDAIVEMNNPGVWILGEAHTDQREGGMGIVVEYAGQQGPPQWQPSMAYEYFEWGYDAFGNTDSVPEPDDRQTLVFRNDNDGIKWQINGKSSPHTDPIIVKANRRYRLILDNQSADPHPIHLHRHTFEVVRVGDQAMSGIYKDVVVVPPWKKAEIDVPTTQPGPSLFHCHQQFHMDMGFKTMLEYSG